MDRRAYYGKPHQVGPNMNTIALPALLGLRRYLLEVCSYLMGLATTCRLYHEINHRIGPSDFKGLPARFGRLGTGKPGLRQPPVLAR